MPVSATRVRARESDPAMARRPGWRYTPRLLGLVFALALPSWASAANPASLPDAAARAGADLWFEEHIAPGLRAPSFGDPSPGSGTAAPASETPLPARAIGLSETDPEGRRDDAPPVGDTARPL